MMMVIVVENVPPRLRGRLSLWLVEARAGVYVGDYSARTRDRIWDQVTAGAEAGSALLLSHAPNESGFDIRTHGPNRREPAHLDGLTLVSYTSLEAATNQILNDHAPRSLPMDDPDPS